MDDALNRLQTFHDLNLTFFGYYNQKIAFQDSENPNDTVKYIDLFKTSHQVGNFLQNEFGLKHQEVVATLLPNIWQYFSIHTGISEIGGILTGLSPQFTPFEISHQLRDSDAVIAFVGPEFLPSVFKVVHECPELRAIVVIGDFKPTTKRFPIPIYLWKDVTRHPSTPPIPKTPINPNEDLCWLPYSSGTTGLPKGVMHTHRGFMLHLKAQLKHVNDVVNPAHELPVSEFHPSFLPVYHAMGFFGMLSAIVKGQTIILLKKYSFRRLLELTEKYKFNAIMGAPSIAHQFIKDPIVKRFDLSSVKILGSGGSKLDDPTIKEIKKRFPHIERIGQGYGMTEAVTGIVMATRRKDEPVGSVGIVIKGVEAKIINPETEQECKIGEVGELRAKIEYIMKGYWKNEKATKDSFDKNGYYKTGDMAVIDEKGYIFIKERLKELIKVKSFQVPPAEVEAVLMMNPKIKDAAVIGIPNFDYDEVPKAFVVPQENCTLTVEEVKDFVAERLSHYKHLKGGVEFIEAIPRTASGKIQRRILREKTKLNSKL